MPINPFTKPAKVGKFVPTESAYPVKKEAQVTGKLKQQYDAARAADSAAERMVENIETAPFSGDQKLKSQIAKRMKERIEKRAQEGDYENMMRQVREDAATTKSLIQPIRQNRKAYEDYVDKVKNMEDVSRERKRQAIKKSLLKYKNQQDGLGFDPETLEPTGGYFEGRVPSKDFNAGEKVMELVKDWQANGRETIQFFNEEGDLVKERIEGADPAKIRQVAIQYLQSNPEFQSYADDKYFEDFYGEEKDLSRFMEKVERVNEKGKKEELPYGRTVHPQNKSVAEVVEQYKSRLKQRDGVSDEQAEELAKQMAHKKFYEYELMSNAAKGAAMKEGYTDRQLDIIKMDDDESGDGIEDYTPKNSELIRGRAVLNPYFKDIEFNEEGETQPSQPSFFENMWDESKEQLFGPDNLNVLENLFVGGEVTALGPGTESIAGVDMEKLPEAANPVESVSKIIASAFDKKTEYSDEAKKRMSNAIASAGFDVNNQMREARTANATGEEIPESNEIVEYRRRDGKHQVKTRNQGWIDKKEFIKQKADETIRSVQRINPGLVQSTTGIEKNAQERFIEQGQAGPRKAVVIGNDSIAGEAKSFNDAVQKVVNELGIDIENANAEKIFEEGFGNIIGKVQPDNPLMPSAWSVQIENSDGDVREIYLASDLTEQAQDNLEFKINQHKFKLEPYNLKMPEKDATNAEKKLQARRQVFNRPNLQYGQELTMMPVNRNGELRFVPQD